MEKKRKTKIQKWDETQGTVETEIEESSGASVENAIMNSPSIQQLIQQFLLI